MRLVFLFGPPAVGKLTIARELAGLTGLPVFHNHLVVDAVGAVFPFGDAAFVELREKWWLDMFGAAAGRGQSLIFTFQPEPSVASDFPARVVESVEARGGQVDFVRLTAAPETIDARIDAESRQEFGKLRSLDLLRELRAAFNACDAAMPEPVLTISTDETGPAESARRIADALGIEG